MAEQPEQFGPVRMHLESVAEGILSPRRRKVVRFETFVLTANDPVQCILPDNPDRCAAYVHAFDNYVALAVTRGQGADNTGIADLSVAATQVYGQLVSSADTGPTPVGGTNAVFAACATAKPARVTVQEISYDRSAR